MPISDSTDASRQDSRRKLFRSDTWQSPQKVPALF